MSICTSEEDIGSQGTSVIDCCELTRGCQELNPGPLEEQQPVFITTNPFLKGI